MSPNRTGKGTEARIRRRIREFDPISLLRLLEYLGYTGEEILFRSNVSSASQIALLEDIEFRRSPVRQVIIYFNFGLLSAQSLLPSYFFKEMDTETIDSRSFIDFLGYFDHFLIQSYLLHLYPEINPRIFPDMDRIRRRYLKMLDLKSPAGLHFLFQLAFPELVVQVQKMTLKRTLETTFPRLGVTRLGYEAIFGREIKVPVYGIRVTLINEDEYTVSGAPWARKISERLEEMVYPILRSVGIDIEIILLILSQKGWAQLQKTSYLGWDRIRGGELNYRRVRIFRGHLG